MKKKAVAKKKTATKANKWKNRIIGHGEADPLKLVDHPGNPKTHPEIQQAPVEANIRELGWIQDVVVNKKTGRILDGHLRVALARKNGESTVPVKYVSLSEEEEYQALLTLDPLVGLAEIQRELMEEALQQVKSGEPELQKFLADLATIEGITPPEFRPISECEQPSLDRTITKCPKCGHEWER